MITYTDHIAVDDYNVLSDAVGWGICKPYRVRMALDRSDFIIAAQEDGRTVGMARIMHDGLQALVMDVAVLPDYQGQGIGKTMMLRVMEYLNALSRDGGIFVNLMSASGKDGFYAQFGFERRPNDKRGPGMTQWIEKQEPDAASCL
jgi:N-acetylglutamate synthase-like GNAT family acetyltransferase